MDGGGGKTRGGAGSLTGSQKLAGGVERGKAVAAAARRYTERERERETESQATRTREGRKKKKKRTCPH